MDDIICKRSFNLLIIYSLWLTVYMGTVYANQTIANIFIVILFCMLALSWIRVESKEISRIVLLWMPFLLWQVFAYVFQMNAERILCWGSCFFILLIGSLINTGEYLKSKMFLYTGFIAILGVWVQLLFPEFHSSRISVLFKKENIDLLFVNGYGISGFTHNIALTAIQIVYGLGAYLYLSTHETTSKKILFYIVFLLTTFMTGKRSCMLIAVIIPFIIKLINDKNLGKSTINSIVGVVIFAILFVLVLFANSNFLEGIPGIHRLFATFEDIQSQEDISSNRSFLWTTAVELFRNNPLFGVGVGKFVQYGQVGGINTDVHNAYLQVLCEQGIVGFVFFVVPIIYCLSATIKKIMSSNLENRGTLFYSLYIQFVFLFLSFLSNPTINQYGYMIYFFAVSAICNKQEIGYE